MTVLVAPGKWLFGDVRWALLLWSLVLLPPLPLASAPPTGSGTVAARPSPPSLVVVPGTITQVDQAWTEPARRPDRCLGRAHRAAGPDGRSFLSPARGKQHLALVVPLLLVWRPFGWRQVLATGALTFAALISPWSRGLRRLLARR